MGLKHGESSSNKRTGKNYKNMRTAIYWDYQNVQLKSISSSTLLVDEILDYAREKGHLRTLKAYANWSSPSIKAETAQNLISAGFELIHIPLTKKNAVDLVISTDLGIAANETDIGTYIIITSDGDFIPALASLRRAGKFTCVIAMPDMANERLQLAADEFLPLTRFQSQPEIIKEHTEEKIAVSKEGEKEELDENLINALTLLREATTVCMNEGRSLRLSSIATAMYELDPSFDIKKLSKLPKKRFQALVKLGIEKEVVLSRDMEGWQELYIPEVEESITDVPEKESTTSGRILTEAEIDFLKHCLKSIPSESSESFAFIHNLMRHKRIEQNITTLSNSALKQLLIGMIDTEIFRKQEEGGYLLSPMWTDLWINFIQEFRL